MDSSSCLPTYPALATRSTAMKTPELQSCNQRYIGSFLALSCLLSGVFVGCESNSEWVDDRLDVILDQSGTDIGGDNRIPETEGWMAGSGTPFPENRAIDNRPPTDNPAASELRFKGQSFTEQDADEIIERMKAMEEPPANAVELTLDSSIKYATEHALDYLNAEQSYMLAGLALLIEEHRWNPQFFNNLQLDAEIGSFLGLEGRFDSALTVVNDFGVSQRLPYGGDVSARLIAGTTNLLDNFFLEGGYANNVDVVLAADIPLLRGAGATAREPLIQARRNLIYSARAFETFRRGYYLGLVADYLDLVVQEQSIENGRRSVALFQQVEARTTSLVEAGRLKPFEADQAKQDTLFEIDRLSGLEESYRLAVDRFKLLIGMPTELPVIIQPEMLDLDAPSITPDAAVRIALQLRLEIQTDRDRIEDLRRQVDLAKNGLLSDLDLSGSILFPLEDPGSNLGFDLSPDEVSFGVGLKYSAALDRVIEKYQVRQSQIKLEQGIRTFQNNRDKIAIEVRSRVRAIERSQFSFLLQERNVDIARNRLSSIEAAPDRASTRDRTEAVNALRRAEDQRDRSARDLQVAILQYLGASGRLRVDTDGNLKPLPGMKNEQGQSLVEGGENTPTKPGNATS